MQIKDALIDARFTNFTILHHSRFLTIHEKIRFRYPWSSAQHNNIDSRNLLHKKSSDKTGDFYFISPSLKAGAIHKKKAWL
jgi:hypothetical protein